VAAVVAVQRLVVVDRAGVLGPELDLVEVQLVGPEVARHGVDEIGMEREVVEIP
jgi:hypothetical protein